MTDIRPSQKPFIVIPTYNEAGNIVGALKRIRQAVPNARVIVVDDSSPDGTADLVKALVVDDEYIDIRVRPAKSGLGSAYRFGFKLARESGATAMIEMDADLSHEPEALPELLNALDDGADMAIGSRYVPGGESPGLSPSRLALSIGGNMYARISLGIPVKDATSGFRAYRPSLLDSIDLDTVSADGYGFQIEMVFRASLLGAKIAERPIIFNQRTEGVSKMSRMIVTEAISLCSVWGLQRRFRQLRGNNADFVPYHKGNKSVVRTLVSSIKG